jgi:type I restriction-modification system DNA methylase subunit
MADRMTQQELESYLWGAAIILRGLVDAGDYKQYVFPLLFYKRLSESRSLPTTAATPPRSFTPTAP